MYKDALDKMQRYCAYQERCHQEVRSKLLEMQVYGDELEEIMASLIEDNFLNEERFAIAFAGGKFRIKQWGRIKIELELKRRQISDYSRKKAMAQIDPEDYWKTILDLVEKKKALYKGHKDFIQKQKVTAALLQRGFELDLVLEALRLP